MRHVESEIWKDVIGYEGRYLVSNYGKVKSLVSNFNGKNCTLTENEIKQYSNKGYLRVALSDKNGVVKYRLVHRLVLSAFNPIDDNFQVNHIDGVKTNNKLENLEWVTQSENMIHAYKIGLENPCNNGFNKQIAVIKDSKTVSVENSIREACRKYNFDRRSVLRTIKGERKQHHGFKFKLV